MPKPANTRQLLEQHVADLRACRRCPDMIPPVVTGRPVPSPVMLVGQAPGDKEPKFGRPFAWTAGKTLFGWFAQQCDMDEEHFRSSVYMAAVCRCFPGKKATGGDRVPAPAEITHCAEWLRAEFALLRPQLVIPVGKLAIAQFLPETGKLNDLIGHRFAVTYADVPTEVIPLPHPSGASPWHRMEPGITLLRQALRLITEHPAFIAIKGTHTRPAPPRQPSLF